MNSSKSSRRESIILLQTVIGAVVCIGWMIVGMIAFEDDLLTAVSKVAPFFVVYEFGVLSRYIPGLSDYAKRLRSGA